MNKIIMNYGIAMGDQFAALPVHVIDGVLCNYAFGKRLDSGEVEYATEVGQLKEDSMRALGKGLEIVDVPVSDKDTMMGAIRTTHSLYAGQQEYSRVVLYRFPKGDHDDSVFYDAMGIQAHTSEPLPFEILGVVPDSPFTSVSILEMFADMPEVKIFP